MERLRSVIGFTSRNSKVALSQWYTGSARGIRTTKKFSPANANGLRGQAVVPHHEARADS